MFVNHSGKAHCETAREERKVLHAVNRSRRVVRTERKQLKKDFKITEIILRSGQVVCVSEDI